MGKKVVRFAEGGRRDKDCAYEGHRAYGRELGPTSVGILLRFPFGPGRECILIRAGGSGAYAALTVVSRSLDLNCVSGSVVRCLSN